MLSNSVTSSLDNRSGRSWPCILPGVCRRSRLPVMQDIMFVDTQHYTFYSWQALEHHARLLSDQLLGVPAAHSCPVCPCRGLYSAP